MIRLHKRMARKPQPIFPLPLFLSLLHFIFLSLLYLFVSHTHTFHIIVSDSCKSDVLFCSKYVFSVLLTHFFCPSYFLFLKSHSCHVRKRSQSDMKTYEKCKNKNLGIYRMLKEYRGSQALPCLMLLWLDLANVQRCVHVFVCVSQSVSGTCHHFTWAI